MLPLVAFALAASTVLPTVSALRWERRVLLVTASDAASPDVAVQRRCLAEISAGGDDRDLVLVEVLGTAVHGASDDAAGLRRAYRLPADRFAVVLVGKDGGEKLRSSRPIACRTLAEAIDAMPMRRNGER